MIFCRLKKKAIADQMIMMIFFMIVISFIIILGISSTKSIESSASNVNYLQFRETFLSYLKTMAYLEVKHLTISLQDISEVCFINDSPSGNNYKENIIKFYYENEPLKNVLLFRNGILVDAISAGKNIVNVNQTDEFENYMCFPNKMGKIDFKVRNYNYYYVVKKE
ncbi:MAG: hypothetical protein PHT94_04015 [Candidatus Nanoarchaeia archaeon]|nr:hypothetical protein [Candidatus Nanoarchaeia archaeon]